MEKSQESKSELSRRKQQEIFGPLKEYRKQFEQLWKDERAAYYGDIWKSSGENRPYENFLFQVVESEVPILTDGFPSATAKVLDPERIEQGKMLDNAIEWVLKQQSFNMKLPMLVKESLIDAPSYLHSYYDANANNGEGEIKLEIIPWQNVWLHGGAQFIEECESAVIKLSRSKNWLKLNYKNYADEIESLKPEEYIESEDGRRGRESFDVGSLNSKRSVPKPYKDKNQLCLTKTFFKDYTIVPIPEEETLQQLQDKDAKLANGMIGDIEKYQDHKAHIEWDINKISEIKSSIGVPPDTSTEEIEEYLERLGDEDQTAQYGELIYQIKLLEQDIEAREYCLKDNPKSGKLKYKNGLRVIEQIDKLVVYDGESRDHHAQIPIVPFYCYRDSTIYGFGELRNILDSQKMYAVMQYKEYKGSQRVLNPRVIIDRESGLTAEDITNEDGEILVLPQGTNVRQDPAGQISPQLGQFMDRRKDSIFSISGINEATQGSMPNPQASGVTVQRLQQQAIGRIRLKDRQLQYYSIKRMGELLASLIIQYWDNDKILDLENDGDFRQVIFSPIELEDLEFNMEISQGSMSGIDKEMFEAKMLQFLQMQQITFKEYLEVSEMPRAEKLKALIEERENKDAQIEELAQENLILKAQFTPEQLTPEEQEQVQQLSQQMGSQ